MGEIFHLEGLEMFESSKALKLVAVALTSSVLLSGCGNELDDRPFVMACRIQDNPYSASSYADAAESDHTFDLRAGGLNLPGNSELESRGADSIAYFSKRFLTASQGELDHERVLTLPMLEYAGDSVLQMERSGHYSYFSNFAAGGPGRVVNTPFGVADIEHFTLDASGELTPVDFRLLFLGINDHGRGSATRQADIGAELPSDARYVIYRYTIRNMNAPFIDYDKSLTTYWAFPLEDKHRWAPLDWEFSQTHGTAFANYAYWLNNMHGGGIYRLSYPLENTRAAEEFRKTLPERNSQREIHSRHAPCLAGSHAEHNSFFSLYGDVGGHNQVTIYESNSRLIRFVGLNESDLELLPEDFSDWEGPDLEKNSFGKMVIDL